MQLTKSKEVIYFDTFILLFIIDMVVFSTLSALGIGLRLISSPNQFARYIYIGIFLLTVFYHFFRKKKIKLNIASFAFLGILPIGIFLGLIQGNVNREFLVHIYTCLMPVFAMSFGWYFFEAFLIYPKIQNRMSQALYITFFSGLLATVIFRVGYFSGQASYSAVGLWNYTFATPFLLIDKRNLLLSIISLAGSFIAAKRIGLLVVSIYFFINIFLIRKNFINFFKVIIMISVAIYFLFPILDEIGVFNRISYAITKLLTEGDIDAATAGRTSEIRMIITYFSREPVRYVFGAGFGSKIEVFESYFRHYSHFTPLSYVIVGGLGFSVIIYGFLILTSLSLLKKANAKILPKESIAYVLLFLGIIISSFTGSVLTNYTTLWVFVGISWRINSKKSQAIKLR